MHLVSWGRQAEPLGAATAAVLVTQAGYLTPVTAAGGSLNYACKAVRGGKCFLRGILDVMVPLRQYHQKEQLSAEFKKDLAWWLTHLRVFNGTVYYMPSLVHVWVDACNISAGAFCEGDWRYTVYQCDAPAVQSLHINYKEVYAAVRAMWAARFQGRTVITHTDSTATNF